jgi:hypothetical protein
LTDCFAEVEGTYEVEAEVETEGCPLENLLMQTGVAIFSSTSVVELLVAF